jgi:hypothetical protein
MLQFLEGRQQIGDGTAPAVEAPYQHQVMVLIRFGSAG